MAAKHVQPVLEATGLADVGWLYGRVPNVHKRAMKSLDMALAASLAYTVVVTFITLAFGCR